MRLFSVSERVNNSYGSARERAPAAILITRKTDMKHVPVLKFIVAAIIAAGASIIDAQQADVRLNTDPDKAEIISSDIDLFWKAYDRAKPDNSLYVFRDEYLRKGSRGLKEFTANRIGSACDLVDVIERRPKYYASLRETSLRAHTFREPMRIVFRKLKEHYPAAVFPDVYLLIGRMNSGGTYTQNALLIGVDMYGLTPETPKEELSDWLKQVLKPVDEIPFIVAHELVHYQQKYPGDRKLLGSAIAEGSADLVAEIISGKHINHHLHEWANPRERQLWNEFQRSIATNDASLWLYNGGTIRDRPADLGYYVGYKIAESYYRNAADKKKAIKEILEITDFEAFLKASRYSEKFAS